MNPPANPAHVPIQYLKGVGEYRASLLHKLGIHTVLDLLEYIPKTYIERGKAERIKDMQIGTYCSFVGTIIDTSIVRTSSGREQLQVMITDGQDVLTCVWFRISNWIKKEFEKERSIWISGYANLYHNQVQFIHPDFEVLEEEKEVEGIRDMRILPVYGLTANLTMNGLREIIERAFNQYGEQVQENLPATMIKQYGFHTRKETLRRIHYPETVEIAEVLKQRLEFEELFYHQLMFAKTKKRRDVQIEGIPFQLYHTYTTILKQKLPFILTKAQIRVINEIVKDVTSGKQMCRLVQGDVGAGKTIVALFILLLAVENGYQGVLMAPTEILAEQHYKTITNLLNDQPEITVTLLKGGVNKEKRINKEAIAEGKIKIIIGTHAVIQKDVYFAKLGLVIIDEQHRFGVEQRASLALSNQHPHLLYLSATPIPRSLALTLYGDLEVSALDELPPHRKSILTIWHGDNKKQQVYDEIRTYLQQGQQMYIVCPLIEESEKIDLLAAETLFEQIQNEIFTEYSSALLHGKMKQKEKEEIMQKFAKNEVQILVSTTVIEVGIDVPNATIMMIEHAERFGLSQLHQLRGRVGRGAQQSICYLISYIPISKIAKERLSTLTHTNNGFSIAEKDLELRGPGEFFGTAQAGMPVFRFASLVRNQKLLQEARRVAFDIIEQDPNMQEEEHRIILETYQNNYAKKEALIDY